MMTNLNSHPCFNERVRHQSGRVHLPVAPNCNLQCNFCNRSFDCLNESRPGVSSVILSPGQALVYLDRVLEKDKTISVVGIAGPGEPFANAEETLQTLRLVREKYPELILCVASNGLDVLPYIERLVKLKVSHLSLTLNAVDPVIGAKIYAWVRYQKKVYRGLVAGELLLKRQLETIKALKAQKIVVKINSIIIPEINDQHIPEIAQKVAELGADIINPIALYPVANTIFGNLGQPGPEIVAQARKSAGKFLSVMNHCSRCRADAVGLLGKELCSDEISALQSAARLPLIPGENRPFVAVASREGILINQHLGEAEELYIYRREDKGYFLNEVRKTPPTGGGGRRWQDLVLILKDCCILLVARAGQSPKQVLSKDGIKVVEMEGLIEDGLDIVFNDREIPAHLKASSCLTCEKSEAGQSCRCLGSGEGCG